jgi:hypothetical protein
MHLLIAHRGTFHNIFVTIRKRLVPKSNRDFLETTASGFYIVEVTQSCREKTEARNDEVKVPTNASECIGRNHTDNEIKNPVGPTSDVR